MRRLNGAVLKWVAICTMLIDHIAYVFSEDITSLPYGDILYFIMRSVGRIAFPIFAFLLVEGFMHTKNAYRYLFHLVIFALISEIPADLAFYDKINLSWNNVFITLSLGLAMLICIKRFEGLRVYHVASALFLGLFSCASWLLHSDYDIVGVLLIYVYYMFREDALIWGVGTFACFITQPFRMFAYPLLLLYNGKRGKQPKYFFYAFYPLHLIILFAIRWLWKGV